MADSGGKLSALQMAVLRILAQLEPPWTLVGGGALVGFHLGHRRTRDLDLFWRGVSSLENLAREAERLLREHPDNLEVAVLQRSPTFVRLEARRGGESVVIDLAIESAPSLGQPEQVDLDGVCIYVAGQHSILVSKLCALLGRSELRDLQDVWALVQAGGDLRRALGDAPSVDGGFSPLTLAWVLKQLPVGRLASAAGVPGDRADQLGAFRDQLIEQLLTQPALEE